MTVKIRILLFLVLYQLHTLHAQTETTCYLADPKASARPNNIDLVHLSADLAFEPEEGLVKGYVEITFIPLHKRVDTFFLDGPKINFTEVKLDKKDVKYVTWDGGIAIYPQKSLSWGSEHKLTIKYEAHPKKGLYFVGWNDPKNNSRKQIWTQGQGIDNRYWLPSFDDMNDKLTTELKITFNKDYEVLSNGMLMEESIVGKDQRLWHYQMSKPHSPYLIMLGIGKYDVKKYKSKSGIEIDCWYYPEYPERVAPTYRYMVEMMDWMEREFGVPYPWEKYSQLPVQDFMYGAMENTMATVFGDFYFIDERAYLDRYYIGTNAHELAHQWFGDYITVRSGEHMWLQESFATHYQKHFERSVFGEDHYQWNRKRELDRVLAAAKRDNNPIVHSNAGGERIYPKGSLVLDMLKYVIGEDEYNKAQTYYLRKHPYQNVDTRDFYLAFLETLGLNLDWFFNQWLYHGGEPHYEVSYLDITRSDKRHTQITVKQSHKMNELVGLFNMPINFEVHYKDGTFSSAREWIADHAQTIAIPNEGNKAVDYVLFDPNDAIIKTVDFPREIEELKSQAAKAKNMIDRYEAMTALYNFPIEEKKDFLLEAYKDESFYAIRAEIVKQLVNFNEEIDTSDIKLFVTDKHAKVRLSAIANVIDIPPSWAPYYEKLLKDSSYYVVEKTLALLSERYPDSIPKYLELTKNDYGVGNSIRVSWLEIASDLDREKYIPQLVDYVSQSYEFLTRVNAMNALKRLNYLDEELIENLFDAALNPNRRLAGPAKSLIKHYNIQTAYKRMLEEYYESKEWVDWQEDILSGIF